MLLATVVAGFRIKHVVVAIAGSLVGLSLSLPGSSLLAAKPQVAEPVLTIDEAQDGEDLRVFHDGDMRYADYQLPGGDPCVDGSVSSDGSLVFFRLNRFVGPDLLCGDDTTGNTPRGFTLRIDEPVACGAFGLAAPCDVTSPVSPVQPHVRAETVFKSKAKATHVSFMFTWDDGRAYRVTTDVQAPMTGTTNTKVVDYSGTATLYQHQGSPEGYVAVSPSFDLPFRLQFDRVVIP